ncbi:hypothetical protein MTO96_024015 [Rhipicephalus appendiculatus]
MYRGVRNCSQHARYGGRCGTARTDASSSHAGRRVLFSRLSPQNASQASADALFSQFSSWKGVGASAHFFLSYRRPPFLRPPEKPLERRPTRAALGKRDIGPDRTGRSRRERAHTLAVYGRTAGRPLYTTACLSRLFALAQAGGDASAAFAHARPGTSTTSVVVRREPFHLYDTEVLGFEPCRPRGLISSFYYGLLRWHRTTEENLLRLLRGWMSPLRHFST